MKGLWKYSVCSFASISRFFFSDTFLFPSSLSFFPIFFPPDVGNYGSSLCHLYIFTAKRDSDDDDATFLEAENKDLLARARAQRDAIASLEEEQVRSRENAELQARLHNNEVEAEMNAKLLEVEKRATFEAQADRAFFMAALHGEKKEREGREEAFVFVFSFSDRAFLPQFAIFLTHLFCPLLSSSLPPPSL